MSDVPADADPQRAAALARVQDALSGMGATAEEVEEAIADDVVDLLVFDHLAVPAEHRMNLVELTERTGMDPNEFRRFWRALGFLDVDDEERIYTDEDVECVALFRGVVDAEMTDIETALSLARVVGSSLSRIAEAIAPATTSSGITGDSVLDADRLVQSAGPAIPVIGQLISFIFRRHIQAAVRRAMLVRVKGTDDGASPVLAVGFADLVGFTLLSQELPEQELAEVVSRFELIAHDTVTGLGGRVVKMIGDEVMFVTGSASDAARIALGLAEAYADDDLLSDVRVGLAVGPVLVQEGDYFGPVVNLASRMVELADPGTVLVSDEFNTILNDEAFGEFAGRPLRPRHLKDLGRVQLWSLLRPGGEEAHQARRRGIRWDRVTDALRDFDDLRGRGERLFTEGIRSVMAPASNELPASDGEVGPATEVGSTG